MSNDLHTPGRWEVGETIKHGHGHRQVIVAADDSERAGTAIAEVYGAFDQECRANACLIAGAPKLLEACQNMLEAFEYTGTRLVGKEWRAKERLKAAVAMAALSDVIETERQDDESANTF